jgi:hypothetical protein
MTTCPIAPCPNNRTPSPRTQIRLHNLERLNMD